MSNHIYADAHDAKQIEKLAQLIAALTAQGLKFEVNFRTDGTADIRITGY